MRAFKYLPVLLFIAIVSLETGLLWQEHRKAEPLRQAADSARSESGRLQARLANLLMPTAPGSDGAPNTGRPVGKAPPPKVTIVHRGEFLHEFPEYGILEKEHYSRGIMEAERQGLAALHLPSETVAKLVDLQFAGMQAHHDTVISAILGGDDAVTANRKGNSDAAVTAITNQIKDLIGADGRASLFQPHASDALARMAGDMVAGIADETASLTVEQCDKFIDAYRDVYDTTRNPDAMKAEFLKIDPATFLSPKSEAFLKRASAFLSPDQLTALTHDVTDNNQLIVLKITKTPTPIYQDAK